jgi:hypothetical protein
LSRRHCRISRCEESGWQVIDMASKNGTLHNGKPLNAPAVLKVGDELVLGRLVARFADGTLEEMLLDPLRAAPVRPADPNESLSGTCAGFDYLEPGQTQAVINFPRPRPAPRVPAAFERDDIYSLLSTIASSSWDSIYEEARRPVAASASPQELRIAPRSVRHRPRSPIDLSLQVRHRGENLRERRSRPRTRRLAGSGASLLLVVALLIFKLWASPHLALAAAQASAPTASAAPVATVDSDAQAFVHVGTSVLTLFF